MAWTKDSSTKTALDYSISFKRTMLDRHIDASEQQPVVESMNLTPAAFLLDAGCGAGRYLANAVAGQRFVGLDLSIEMLKVARNGLKSGMYIVGEVERLPFKDNAFDEVINVRVLQHIRDQGLAIRELARVCKAKGDVIVLSHNSWVVHCLYKNFRMGKFGFLRALINAPFQLLLGNKSIFAKWAFEYDNYCSMPELSRMFKAAGLQVIEKKGGTFGAPWFFKYFYLGWLLEKIAPGLLKLYLGVCLLLEKRLGKIFPFTHVLMDKLIVKGVKTSLPKQ